MPDILATLRTAPIIKLSGDKIGLAAGKIVRQMMVERAQAADEIERLRIALLTLANACDDVGVKYFDTDTMSPQVAEMNRATVAARSILTECT